jgi:pyruvate dehydrogenase E2 component (dihydrolipoamide acetyltransferase)
MEFVLPRLDGAEEEAEIIAWLVKNGDSVAQGQPVLEITFEKASVAVEAPATGTIDGITSGPGDIVAFGQVLATID